MMNSSAAADGVCLVFKSILSRFQTRFMYDNSFVLDLNELQKLYRHKEEIRQTSSTLFQTTNFRLLQTERVCRRQFQI